MTPTDSEIDAALTSIERHERWTKPTLIEINDLRGVPMERVLERQQVLNNRLTQAAIDGDGKQERRQLMYNAVVRFRRPWWRRYL